jgi:transposase
MKNKIHQTHYRTQTRNVQLKIDEAIAERMIPADDSVRLLDQMVEEMDSAPLMRAYKRIGRRPATHPVTLLKILLYAIMQGIYSSRDIARACTRDINFIWLLDGEKAPNHSEIARFRSKRLPECAQALFYQIVDKLSTLGEICFEHLFVDGTKIEANANKYTFVWKNNTTKYEARVDAKLEKLLPELADKYGVFPGEAKGLRAETEGLLAETKELLAALEGKVNFPFVHGRGKRKSELQKDIEALQELLKRKAEYAALQATFGGRNSFSKTDPDATFMRMKDDHMHNAQLKPGYNLQIGVEGEYITGVHVCAERNDQLALIPLLETMEQNTGKVYEDVTADAGYESEENYTYFEGKSTECYIKPQNYERSKTRKYKGNMALRENMAYDPELDEYTCQAGKKLRVIHTGTHKSKSGFTSEITTYECESCEGCAFKESCTKAKGNRQLKVSKKFIEQRAKSLERITSATGVQLRKNRSIQVEGTFGVIKQDYGFRQCLLRGKRKVFTEILLVAMGYNINKLHNKIQSKRTGKQLFGKLLA